MKIKFTSGKIDELKTILRPLTKDAGWKEINLNTYQTKIDGVSINFYSTTGTIQIQGKTELALRFEEIIADLIDGKDNVDVNIVVPEVTTQRSEEVRKPKMLSDDYSDSEIIIGLVGAVGVEYREVKAIIKQ